MALFAMGLLASPARAEHSVLQALPGDVVGISSAGSQVVFATATPLRPEDTDSQTDLYLSSGGTYELLTTGPTGGNGPFSVCGSCGAGVPRVTAPSGTDEITHVYFMTSEQLVAEDLDTAPDLYEHSASGTALITTGPTAGVNPYTHTLRGVSPSGDKVLFDTGESLVAEDTDGRDDVYERSGGTTKLVSTGPLDSNNSAAQTCCSFAGSTPDASHVFFYASEPLTADDDDSSNTDVYVRAGGVTKLVSTAPASSGGAQDAGFAGTSDDGSRVFIRTRGVLTPDDTDNAFDIYEMTPGGPVLTSTGPTDAPGSSTHTQVGVASADGSRYWFVSGELLVPGTGGIDVYERSGGTTTLVSTGPTDTQNPYSVAGLGGVFDGGARVVFSTDERLVAADLDSSQDLYERAGATTTLLSTGPAGGNGAFTPFLVGAAADGSRYFFSTDEQLTPSDTDTKFDLYERAGGATTHISYGPPTIDVTYSGAIVSENGTPAFRNIVARIASGTYARPKGATPLLAPLVVAFQQCLNENTNRTHGPPLAFPSCAPATRSGSQLVVGTPDFNGLPAKSIGSVRLDTLAGIPSTPADEADVRLTLSDTDIHKVPDLQDYDGEVQVVLDLRITDKDGPTLAGGGPAAVTSQTTSLKWTAQCAATADTTIGGACAATTTADALVPGVVTEGRRSIWALERVSVLDGGLDGDVETTPADNWLFQTQGLFVP